MECLAGTEKGRLCLELGVGVLDCGHQGKNSVDLRHFEEVHHPIVSAGNNEFGAPGLASHVMIHHQAHSGGIHIWHVGDVDNGQRRGCRAAKFGLKFEQVAQGERAAQAEYPGPGTLAVLAVDCQWAIIQHSETSVRNEKRKMITVL